MRNTLVVLCALLFLLLCLEPAQAQLKSAPSESYDQLALKPDDLSVARRLLPGLVEVTRKGQRETATFFARQDVSFLQLTRILSNISVAYSAITFDEWMKELQPQMAAAKPGEYTNLVEQSRKQIDEITAMHRRAQRGGRSALAHNTEIVSSNIAVVEELIGLLREIRVESLPQEPPDTRPATTTPSKQ